MISKKEFCRIINRLRNYDDLQKKINNLFDDWIDNRENDFCNAGSICIGHETVVVDLLKDIFQDDTDLLGWWLYELDYGRAFTIGAIVEEDGSKPDLTTPEKLYDYLVRGMEK